MLLRTQTQELSEHRSSISTIEGKEKHHEQQLTHLQLSLKNTTKEIQAIKQATSQLDTKQVLHSCVVVTHS